MTNRTIASKVDQIMDLPSSFSDEDIERYITVANVKIDDVLGSDVTMGETLKAEIECYLAAHLISMTRVRTARQEEIDGATIEYTGRYGMSLQATPYGQTVLTLDTTGKLAQAGSMQAGLLGIKTDN